MCIRDRRADRGVERRREDLHGRQPPRAEDRRGPAEVLRRDGPIHRRVFEGKDREERKEVDPSSLCQRVPSEPCPNGMPTAWFVMRCAMKPHETNQSKTESKPAGKAPDMSNPSAGENEGEGSRTADRRYREGVRQT